jgi:hypothetical protein
MMLRWQAGVAKAGVALSALALLLALPHARSAHALLDAQNDPARLSDLQLGDAMRNDPDLLRRTVLEALDAGDADLAHSAAELARSRAVPLPDELTRRIDAADAEQRSGQQIMTRFATGLVTGQADDAASLTGTIAGDLFVFGDIRDVVREGKQLASGENADRLVLGLAATGIAITAATYVSVGAATPVRAGLSLVKDARKVGRLGEGLALWAGRSAREVVDAPALQRAVRQASMVRPGPTIAAVKAAFRTEKAGGLMRLAKDVGRVGEKAGARGALDALKVSEGPKDIARAARLAEAKGGQTRAIIKILGRGALVLTTGAWNAAWWLFGALMMLFGFVTSVKAGTERMTQSWLDRRKRKRARAQLAQARDPQKAAATDIATA